MASIRESRLSARHSTNRRCDFLAAKRNHETLFPAPRLVTAVSALSSSALVTEVFAAGMEISGSNAITNGRGLETPKRPTNRASYTPGGTFEAMVTANLLASDLGVALMPGCEK